MKARSSDGGSRRVLYLTYDGLTDPLGRSQILPYLTGLAARGHRISIISCEKPDRFAADGADVSAICKRGGLEWHPLRFHKRPPILSTLFDMAAMSRVAFRLQRRSPFDFVHCRSYISALIGDRLRRRAGLPYIFDMRGFWVDERVEMGLWPLRNPLFKLVHRYFKRAEQRLVANAKVVVCLTEAARQEMTTWESGKDLDRRTQVIPCCVDFTHFDGRSGKARKQGRELLGIGPDVPLLIYLGSLGGNHLLDEMLRVFAGYRRARPEARFLLVTHHDAASIVSAAGALDIAPEELIVRSASRDEVPLLVAAADLGVAFKRPSYSSKACSPTKIGEMLAMGVPVIANDGVGDTAGILRESGAGVVVDRFDPAALDAAVRAIDEQKLTAGDIRNAALRSFNLEDGIDAYDAIYKSIGERAEAPAFT